MIQTVCILFSSQSRDSPASPIPPTWKLLTSSLHPAGSPGKREALLCPGGLELTTGDPGVLSAPPRAPLSTFGKRMHWTKLVPILGLMD